MSGVVRYAHGKRNHVMTPAENGPFVRACDYDTLRAQLEAAEPDKSFATEVASLREWKARAEAAEAECARLRADADRFRFIAAQPTDEWMSDSGDSFRTLAEAVDASMAARTKEQQA